MISADSALTLLCSTFPPVFERAHLRLDGVIYEQMNAFAANDTAGTVAARMKVVVHDDLTANAEAVATTSDVSVNVGSDDTIYLSSPFEGLRLWWVAGANRPRVPGMNHFTSTHTPMYFYFVLLRRAPLLGLDSRKRQRNRAGVHWARGRVVCRAGRHSPSPRCRWEGVFRVRVCVWGGGVRVCVWGGG